MKIIVLKTTGKNDEVDSVSVFLFNDIEDADSMVIKRKNYPDIVIDVPDLMVITNGNAKRSIQE